MTWRSVTPMPGFDPAEPIVGLSFKQPYASAIIDGPKRIENRPWAPPKRLTGRPFWLAIHAGIGWYERGLDSIAVWRADVPEYHGCEGDLNAWLAAPARQADYPTRAILGLARVVGCWDYELEEYCASAEANPVGTRWPERQQLARARLAAGAAWAFGPYCWELDPIVIRLPQPIPHQRGMLGLWALPPDLDAALRIARADPALYRSTAAR